VGRLASPLSCRLAPSQAGSKVNGAVRSAASAHHMVVEGKKIDGKPLLRYITLIREGARAHGLPGNYIRFLEGVEHVQ